MGHLTKFEKGQIVALYHEFVTMRAIGEAIKRDPTTVHRFLARYKQGKAEQKPKNAQKLSSTRKRALLRAASNGMLSAAQLKSQLNLPITVRRVQQVLSDTPHFTFR